MSLNVKVGLIGVFDMLKFKNMSADRDKFIESGEAKDIKGDFAINQKAKELHPDYMKLKVSEIIDRGNAKEFVFSSLDGKALPLFRAGSYLSIKLHIGETYTSRPYSISSSPKLAEEGKVSITVEDFDGSFVPGFMHKELSVGDIVTTSGPEGHFYYDGVRDKKNVVALAGGSGVTPFISMAYAIRDGYEDFNLTLLYGSRKEDGIFFKDELDEIQKATDKVKVVHILSDEEKEGYEHGFISAELIKKYAPEEFSVFACGPKNFYVFMKKEIEKLNLPKRLVRFEMEAVDKSLNPSEGYDEEAAKKVYKAVIRQCGRETSISVRADETILVAIERAGIKAPSRCRSGECGWCRARLVKGKTYSPKDNDFRRKADKELGFVHPCASFALSDIVLEVTSDMSEY